jgi:hypothetical protein
MLVVFFGQLFTARLADVVVRIILIRWVLHVSAPTIFALRFAVMVRFQFFVVGVRIVQQVPITVLANVVRAIA